VLSLLLTAAAATALSPSLSIHDLEHQSWADNRGSEPPRIHRLIQTKNGYLWAATNVGLLQFDGLRFSDAPLAAGQRAPDIAFNLLAARDGAVWLARGARASRVDRGRVTDFKIHPVSRVTGLFEDSSGVIWIGTEKENETFVQSLSPATGEVRRFGAADGLPPGVLAFEPDGAAFWLGIEGAICRWIPGSPAACHPAAGSVWSLAPGAAGEVYGATPGSIYRVSAGALKPVPISLPRTIILNGRLLVDRDGVLWAASTGGLLRIRGGSVENFARKQGLSGETVNDIVEDAEGDIWVATNNGIDRFRSPRVIHLSTLHGLSGESVNAVKATRDGSVWVGTSGNGLDRIRGVVVTNYSPANSLPIKVVNALEEDAAGRLWVAGDSRDLAYFENGRFVRVPTPGAWQRTYALAADSRGGVWAAGSPALWRIADGAVHPVDTGQFIDIFRVFHSRDAAVWLGAFHTGVLTLSHPGAAVAGPLAGIGPNPRNICQDAAGAIWVGAGPTLSRIRGGKVTSWGAAQGLAAGDIYGMTVDRRGDLWIATNQAMLRVAISDLARSPDGEALPASFTRFDSEDGLRIKNTGLASPRVTTAADGRIWFIQRDGVGILDPELLRGNPVPPPVVIEQFSVDGVPLHDPAPRFRGRQLRIGYTGISLMAPERVSFRWRLEPASSVWTEAQGNRTVDFASLPPGNYRFRVTACNLDNVCNEAGAAVDFRVMPFFYQTVWFKLVLLAAGCACAWGAYKLRLRQVVSRLKLVAQERARITREIHDSLLQGFAGVVLQLDVASRQFTSDPAKSKARLDRAIDLADQSLGEARQMLLDMRLPMLEDRTLAEALAEVGENATRGASIAFHLRTRGDKKVLPYPEQALLFLIGREAITNAVNHAMPTHITVHIVSDDKQARLLVQDDGIGFDVEAAKRKAGHLGVQGMTERASVAGAELSIDTAPGKGSRIEVVVPRKKA
jgi:signal transduction histidine kinase/ligand-binding sensor domain-containing protein